MTHTETDNQLIVEDVVSALTGEGVAGPGNVDLKSRMEAAASEFDKRTAKAFGQALLDSLCEDPGNLRQLEALLILGLAHPDVLEQHRISLAVEGRRLAILLERVGETDRARCLLELLCLRLPNERTIDHELAGILRRTGCTGELVDRYMRRAEECTASGNIAGAIPWLQEILLLDRSRRDVARMIRDLRYQEADREGRVKRRNRFSIIVLMLSALGTAVYVRDRKVQDKFDAIQHTVDGDVDSVYARIDAITALIDQEMFWFGMWPAIEERSRLQMGIESLEQIDAREAHEVEVENLRRREMAEDARLRGILNVEKGAYEEAIVDLKQAQSLADEGWEHHEQVEADIAAIETLIGGLK